MQLLAQFSTSHLFLIGLLTTSTLILFQTYRRWQRTALAKPFHRHSDSGRPPAFKRHVSAKPAEAREWEVEMHEHAREVSARIDSKMAALEHLMRAAHLETQRLQEAIARAESAGVLQPLAHDD